MPLMLYNTLLQDLVLGDTCIYCVNMLPFYKRKQTLYVRQRKSDDNATLIIETTNNKTHGPPTCLITCSAMSPWRMRTEITYRTNNLLHI